MIPAVQQQLPSSPPFPEELGGNAVAEAKAQFTYVSAFTPGGPKYRRRKER